MKKLNIIYWSGTGNTEKMAELILEGAKGVDNLEAQMIDVSSASKKDVEECDLIALGCPSMGDEVLEEGEMEPFMESIEGSLSGKKIALFGSYGWGDGKWMRDWEERMNNCGGDLVDDGLIVNGEPSGDAVDQCKGLGKLLAES
ncbi:flavodoxin [Clostridiisalibacter paucivorans]|uniref:flavodoxin n=1 Tax=Clostridiisalibacter paucivorans TaxID=408753 RepID=UPI00047D0A39|nr:flavodoxin [Clostridiisalibacter paucivorans]